MAHVNNKGVSTAIVGGAHPYAEDLSALRNFSPTELLAF